MTIDLARARADTPGTATVAHLNNAGSALRPRVVTDTVLAHLRREDEIGGYEAEDEARDRLAAVYGSVATLVGAHADEIALVESATVAWDVAFASVPLRAGERILTARTEYVSNAIALLQACERTGAVLEVVEDDEHGQVDVDALAARLDDDVALVALTHVATGGGLVNPAAAVGRLTRAAGIPYLLDACQSVGQLHVDVDELGCDLLAATGRKFLRGPRGTGFLYASRAITPRLVPPVLGLDAATWTSPTTWEPAPDARRFETWERNVAGLLGLGAAADYALGWGTRAIEARAVERGERLRGMLAEVPGVTVRDKGVERCAIVTFTVDGVPAAEVRDALRAAGVNVSITRSTSSQLDLAARGLTEVVRASPHYYTSDDDLERAVAALPRR
ncbi:aminotransferase class V-fold PLP-dependent enzyme [Cellulomonas sp.]|uniref:aminotransferase class V-fold PLP-dependent enzyme n=1 Tax=Cellulomonas sp. TaxID=40001 RepID=UPI001B019F7E|nr:aminotransferase class V-fold PLP-dependent enzyme [Cellulomonas sp.]MBO9556616.1 aminotransferase class V-fold PLP-dependent enzyme [Cellulomonas sp.]